MVRQYNLNNLNYLCVRSIAGILEKALPNTDRLKYLRFQRDHYADLLNQKSRLVKNLNDPSLQTTIRNLASLDTKIRAIQGPPSPPPINRWKSLLPGAANGDQFLTVGHCLFAALAGVAGGFLACCIRKEDSGDEDGNGRIET
jgi:hypothetical protein